MRNGLNLFICCLLLFLPFSQAQAVLITVTQSKLVAGGELEVLVEAASSQVAEPDLELPTSWQTHFLLVDKMHQVEAKVRGDYMHRWSLVLQHQQADSISRFLQLEPLKINGRASQPLRISIEAARKKTPAKKTLSNQPFTMQQQVDFSEAYLGQTLVYELLIRYQGFPLKPRLSPLEVEGATARELGEGREQGFNQRGVNWQEARWQELIQLHTRQVIIGPRYFSSRLSLAGQTSSELYETSAPELKIKVRPIPDSWPKNQPWLPALGVQLEAAFMPPPKQAKQGEALELTIHLDVVGQQARNLPQFKGLVSKGWRIEPLTEELSDRILDGLLVGSLKQRLLLYPQETGNLQLPDLTLNWWDVREHKAVTTQVKLGQLQVSANELGEVKTIKTKQLASATKQKKSVTSSSWLAWLFFSLGVLASLLASAWWLLSLPKAETLPPLNP